MNLSEFLLARIAEDEEAARKLPETRWYVDDDGCIETPIDTGPDGEDNLPNHHNSWYLALDPAHVLAECESKRAIIHACTHEVENWVTIRPGVRQNMPVRVPWGDDDLYEDALKFLAMPYADHPDYDPEWRP